jgi:hypothetical protein
MIGKLLRRLFDSLRSHDGGQVSPTSETSAEKRPPTPQADTGWITQQDYRAEMKRGGGKGSR